MRVSWIEVKIPNDVELDWYPDADWSECDKHYEGTVIGITRSVWGTVYLSVACGDGKIRECNQSNVFVIESI
jgi:hypothetical protein